jgi:SAM-dependent methyltransferase
VGVFDRAFAALYDPMLRSAERAGLATLRAELLGDLEGTVVELGAGTGANLDHYGPGVGRVLALEPEPAMASRLRRRAAGGDHADRVEVVEAPAEAVPLGDGEADAVVATLVLCTVPDVTRSVAEAHRVLRPGGRLVLLEHIRGEGATLRLQRALAPAWRVVGRGCHLTRDPRPALASAGFDLHDLRATSLPLPAPTRPGLVGTAVRG